MRVVRTLVLVAVAVASSFACGMDPITAANVQGCIKKNCDEHDAVGYQTCEASCRQRYGR